MSVPQKSLSVESTDSERERERQWEFQLRFPANQLGVDTDGEDSQNEMDDNDKENIIDDITTTEEEDDDIIKDIVTTEEEDISTTEEEEKDVEAKEEAADEEEGAEHGSGVHTTFEYHSKPTIHHVLPAAHLVMVDIAVVKQGDNSTIKKLKKEMKKQMRIRWLPKIEMIHYKATFLCLAYRDKQYLTRQSYLDSKAKRIFFKPRDKRREVIASIREDIQLIARYDELTVREALNRSADTDVEMQVFDIEDEEEEIKTQSVYDKLCNDEEEEEEEEVLYADEVDKYLDIKLSKAERRVCMDNPLIWWQQNPHDLILMQRLARFVFTIKGSSCPSEGMFRDYGNIVGAKTARLNEKKAEDTLFLHQLRKGLDD